MDYKLPSFILPANGQATPEMVARKRRLAESLMSQGIDTSPVEHPFQALARIGQAGIGGYTDYQAGEQEKEGRDSTKASMAKLLQSDNPSTADLLAFTDNPWLSDGQGRIAAALMEENIKSKRPKDPIKAGPGDVILDPNNEYKVLYEGSPKGTDDITEYNFYVDQATKSGQTPLPFNEFMMSMKKPGLLRPTST
jgi:hypothetical protein